MSKLGRAVHDEQLFKYAISVEILGNNRDEEAVCWEPV